MTALEVAEIGARLLDDAYMVWLTAESDSGRALHAWLGSGPRNVQDAYHAYRAALDREEAAARDLQRIAGIAEPCRALLRAG